MYKIDQTSLNVRCAMSGTCCRCVCRTVHEGQHPTTTPKKSSHRNHAVQPVRYQPVPYQPCITISTSINQLINQTLNQPSNQLSNQLINQPINQLVDHYKPFLSMYQPGPPWYVNPPCSAAVTGQFLQCPAYSGRSPTH